MTEKRELEINWELTTWKGSRLQQHREFYALPFARKLKIIEEMCEASRHFKKSAPPPESHSSLDELPGPGNSSDRSVDDGEDKPKDMK